VLRLICLIKAVERPLLEERQKKVLLIENYLKNIRFTCLTDTYGVRTLMFT